MKWSSWVTFLQIIIFGSERQRPYGMTANALLLMLQCTTNRHSASIGIQNTCSYLHTHTHPNQGGTIGLEATVKRDSSCSHGHGHGWAVCCFFWCLSSCFSPPCRALLWFRFRFRFGRAFSCCCKSPKIRYLKIRFSGKQVLSTTLSTFTRSAVNEQQRTIAAISTAASLLKESSSFRIIVRFEFSTN